MLRLYTFTRCSLLPRYGVLPVRARPRASVDLKKISHEKVDTAVLWNRPFPVTGALPAIFSSEFQYRLLVVFSFSEDTMFNQMFVIPTTS